MKDLKIKPLDESKPTVGKVAVDLMAKAPETTNPIEQMRESLSDYEKEFWQCVGFARAKYDGDFYIVVITKNEKLLPNVFRNFFLSRRSCPTPDWDQTVYKYKRKQEEPIYIWTVPSKAACEYLTLNANQVVNEERGLLRYVMAFNDGTLLKLSKELNNEMPDSPELRDFIFKG